MIKASEEVLEVKEGESEAKPILTDREKKLVDVSSKLYNIIVMQGVALENIFKWMSWLDTGYKDLKFNEAMLEITDYLKDDLGVTFTKVKVKEESAKEEVTATET